MINPGLSDREKDIAPYLRFDIGLCGKWLLKQRQGTTAFALIDQHLARFETKLSRPLRVARLKMLICFLRMSQCLRKISRDKLFLYRTIYRVWRRLRLTSATNAQKRNAAN